MERGIDKYSQVLGGGATVFVRVVHAEMRKRIGGVALESKEQCGGALCYHPFGKALK